MGLHVDKPGGDESQPKGVTLKQDTYLTADGEATTVDDPAAATLLARAGKVVPRDAAKAAGIAANGTIGGSSPAPVKQAAPAQNKRRLPSRNKKK